MPTDPTPTEQVPSESTPVESTPFESTPTDPTPSDGDAGYSVDSIAPGAERGRTASEASDPSAPEIDGERDTADPEGDRVAALERRVTELEAGLEAVRGLLDGVEAVDEAAERRASTALAKVEALEERFAPEEGLVRERLPETEDDDRSGAEGGRTARRGAANREADPDPERESNPPESRVRVGRTGETAGRAGGVGSAAGGDGRTSTAATGSGRAGPPDREAPDRGAADGGSIGSGAISSVGGSADDGTVGGDEERSLAARLRDAVR